MSWLRGKASNKGWLSAAEKRRARDVAAREMKVAAAARAMEDASRRAAAAPRGEARNQAKLELVDAEVALAVANGATRAQVRSIQLKGFALHAAEYWPDALQLGDLDRASYCLGYALAAACRDDACREIFQSLPYLNDHRLIADLTSRPRFHEAAANLAESLASLGWDPMDGFVPLPGWPVPGERGVGSPAPDPLLLRSAAAAIEDWHRAAALDVGDLDGLAMEDLLPTVYATAVATVATVASGVNVGEILDDLFAAIRSSVDDGVEESVALAVLQMQLGACVLGLKHGGHAAAVVQTQARLAALAQDADGEIEEAILRRSASLLGGGIPGQPAWLADPTARHEHRYWDGSTWTEHVADRGVAATDDL